MSKKSLGQFFTTNVDYILDGMDGYVSGKETTDPFAGKCDLLLWAKKHSAKSYTGYDIDKKLVNMKIVNDISIIENDSLASIPPSKFIITNPPYLAKNKMSEAQKKKVSNDYEDLYLLSLKKIIDTDCDEGIAVVPVNFFSAENSNSLRKEFLSRYAIDKINYFTEQVFDDTTYNVASFHFYKSVDYSDTRTLNICVYPEKKHLSFIASKQFDYKIGGKDLADIFAADDVLHIKRLTEKTVEDNRGDRRFAEDRCTIDAFLNDFKTETRCKISASLRDRIAQNIIVINCIDGKKDDNKICAENIRNYGKSALVGKVSSRNIAYLLLDGATIGDQLSLIEMFNAKLNDLRDKYASLFLTNFRDNNRKRISFDFCYALLNYCYANLTAASAKPLTTLAPMTMIGSTNGAATTK
jgi:hypothetical protein